MTRLVLRYDVTSGIPNAGGFPSVKVGHRLWTWGFETRPLWILMLRWISIYFHPWNVPERVNTSTSPHRVCVDTLLVGLPCRIIEDWLLTPWPCTFFFSPLIFLQAQFSFLSLRLIFKPFISEFLENCHNFTENYAKQGVMWPRSCDPKIENILYFSPWLQYWSPKLSDDITVFSVVYIFQP